MDKFETIIISTKERIIILHLRVSKFLYTLKSVWITMSHLNLKKIRFALIVYYRKTFYPPRKQKLCEFTMITQQPTSEFFFQIYLHGGRSGVEGWREAAFNVPWRLKSIHKRRLLVSEETSNLVPDHGKQKAERIDSGHWPPWKHSINCEKGLRGVREKRIFRSFRLETTVASWFQIDMFNEKRKKNRCAYTGEWLIWTELFFEKHFVIRIIYNISFYSQ